ISLRTGIRNSLASLNRWRTAKRPSASLLLFRSILDIMFMVASPLPCFVVAIAGAPTLRGGRGLPFTGLRQRYLPEIYAPRHVLPLAVGRKEPHVALARPKMVGQRDAHRAIRTLGRRGRGEELVDAGVVQHDVYPIVVLLLIHRVQH